MAQPTRVYVDMVGDLFHPGHVALLRAARDFGDQLVVGVLSDEVVTAYKRRPIMTMSERLCVIEACRYGDDEELSRGRGRPLDNGFTDLPLMTRRIDNPADKPPVLLVDG